MQQVEVVCRVYVMCFVYSLIMCVCADTEGAEMEVNLQLEFCLCPRWPPPPRFAAHLKTERIQCIGTAAVDILQGKNTCFLL